MHFSRPRCVIFVLSRAFIPQYFQPLQSSQVQGLGGNQFAKLFVTAVYAVNLCKAKIDKKLCEGLAGIAVVTINEYRSVLAEFFRHHRQLVLGEKLGAW